MASLMGASPVSPGDRRIAIITRPRLPVPVMSTLNGACKRRATIWPTRWISGVEQGDVSGELGKPAQGNRLGDPNLTPLGVLPVRAVAHRSDRPAALFACRQSDLAATRTAHRWPRHFDGTGFAACAHRGM